MNNNKKKMSILFAALLLSVSVFLGACGTEDAPMTNGGAFAEKDTGAYDEGLYETADSAAEDPEAMAEGDDESGQSKDTALDDAANKKDSKDKIKEKMKNERIVYTGSLTIQTTDFDKSYKKIKKRIEKYDAILQYENQTDSNEDWYYEPSDSQRSMSMEIRIPSEHFKDFMDGAGDLGNVAGRDVHADNITSSYIDTQERLKALKTEKKKLEQLMEKANKLKDILELQSRITDLQYEIESAQSRLEQMDTDVAYSTLTIYLNEVSIYTSTPKTFVERVGAALVGSGRFFVQLLQGLVIGLIYIIPPALLFAVCLYVIIRVVRKLRRRRAGKPKKEKQPKQPQKAISKPTKLHQPPRKQTIPPAAPPVEMPPVVPEEENGAESEKSVHNVK